MVNKITLIMPYYEAPKMLEYQLSVWEGYPYSVWENFKFIIVDDASPKYPALNIIGDTHLPLSLYRIHKDIPWHQHAARNLGAYVADDGWLLLTDMCRVLTAENADRLIHKNLEPDTFYKFKGRQMPENEETYQACNTLLVTRDKYWAVDGYDETFCGTYGGDATLIKPLQKICLFQNFQDIYFEYHDYIEDSKAPFTRKEGVFREKYFAKLREKKLKCSGRKKPLQFEWNQVL